MSMGNELLLTQGLVSKYHLPVKETMVSGWVQIEQEIQESLDYLVIQESKEALKDSNVKKI